MYGTVNDHLSQQIENKLNRYSWLPTSLRDRRHVPIYNLKEYHTILGLHSLKNKDIQGARYELKKLSIIEIESSIEPSFVLACQLLKQYNDKDIVHSYLRKCRAYYDVRKRDASSRRISRWIKTLEDNEIPDMGEYCQL